MQDLEFPAACHRLKLTPDGEYLFATGIHAPRVRVYELSQLSLKFERHFDAEVVDFQVRMQSGCPNLACISKQSPSLVDGGAPTVSDALTVHTSDPGRQLRPAAGSAWHARGCCGGSIYLQAWPPGLTVAADRWHPTSQILTEDFSKAVFLCADRSVHLHARYGAHFKTRVPRFGRDLAYAPETADLLIAASSPEIYR